MSNKAHVELKVQAHPVPGHDPDNIKPKSAADLKAQAKGNNDQPIALEQIKIDHQETKAMNEPGNIKPKTLEELNKKSFFDERDNKYRVQKLIKLTERLSDPDVDIELDEMKFTKVNKYKTYNLVKVTAEELKKMLTNYDLKEESYLKFLGINKIEKDLYSLQLDVYIDRIIRINLKELTLDENVDIIFSLYDRDQNAAISKEETFELIKYFGKISLLEFDPATYQIISERLFTDMDKNRRGYITKDDLKAYLQQFKEKEVTMNPFIKVKSYAKVTKIRPNSTQDDSQIILPENAKENERVARKKQRSKAAKFWFLNKKMCIWTFIYIGLCIASGIINRQLEAGRIYQTTLAARFFAGVIFLNFSLLFLFMCITTTTFISQNNWIKTMLPLGDTIWYHQVCGCVLGVNAVIHILIHLCGDYVEVAAKCIVQPAKAYVTVAWLVFENITGMAGFLCMIVYSLIIVLPLIPYIRNQKFEVFYYVHKLFYLGIILLVLHANTPDTARWPVLVYLILPSALFLIELIFRILRYCQNKTKVARVKYLRSGVIVLEIVKPNKFTYLCGQYGILNIPVLSKLEWHPFTFASANEDDNIFFFIAAAGDWTKALKGLEKKEKKAEPQAQVQAEVKVEVKIEGI